MKLVLLNRSCVDRIEMTNHRLAFIELDLRLQAIMFLKILYTHIQVAYPKIDVRP